MFNLKKQQNKWNKILSERKYRPSFFGLSVHFDWKIMLVFVLISLVTITVFGFNMQNKINEVSEKDYTNEVQVGEIERIEIDKFNEKLELLKN